MRYDTYQSILPVTSHCKKISEVTYAEYSLGRAAFEGEGIFGTSLDNFIKEITGGIPICHSKRKLRHKLENILPLETVSSIFPRPLSPKLGCQNVQTCGQVIFTKRGCLHLREVLEFLVQPFHRF